MKKYLLILLISTAFELWAQNTSSADYLKYFKLNLSAATGFTTTENSLEHSSTLLGGSASFLLSEFKYSTNLEKYNFGLCVKTDNILKKFPCQLKVGNLSVGGSYSKLSNPLLSAPTSPFSTPSTIAQFLSASLPAASSFSKPETLFFQFSYADSKTTIQDVKTNIFYNPCVQEVVVSSFIKIRLPAKLILTLSSTTGCFTLDENTFSSWFTTEDFYYHAQNILCSSASASISAKKFGSAFSANIYESPFGNFNGIFKTDNFVKFLHSTISLSFLYCPRYTITSSQKNISNCFQVISGYVYQIRCPIELPFFIKTGFKLYGDFDLSDTNHDFRFTTGIQLTSNLTSLTLTGLLNAKIKSDYGFQSTFNNASLQLTNIWYFKKVTTTLKTSFTINPASDFSYTDFSQKYSVNLSFNKLISTTSAVNITLKDEELKKMSVNSTFQLKIHKNRINYTYKLTFDWQSDS